MKIAYWILNGIAVLLMGLALLSMVYPSLNDLAVQYAGGQAMFGPLFAYLVLSGASTLVCFIAIAVGSAEAPRFPYYCIALTWAPLLLLAMLGGVLIASGKLYW